MKVLRGALVPPPYVGIRQMLGLPLETNSQALPTSSNQTPFYTPICLPFNCRLEALVVPFGTPLPGDTTTANLRVWMHESLVTRHPGAVLKTAENFIMCGAGHVRVTTDTTIIGSAQLGYGLCTFSAPVSLTAGVLYYIGSQWEGTFDAGAISVLNRQSNFQPRKLSAGAQAFGYAPSTSPTTIQLASGDQLLRPDFILKLSA